MSDEPEYFTLQQAADLTGIKKPSIHGWIKAFRIEKHYFHGNKTYITREDAHKLKKVREKPWLAEEMFPKRSTEP